MSKNKKVVPIYKIKTKEMEPFGFDVIDLSVKGGKAYDSAVQHRHTFFELLFFKNDTGTHEIDFKNYSVHKHSVHFVSPGQIHKLTIQKTEGYVVCFTEDFVSLKSEGSFTEQFPFYDSSNPAVLKLDKKLSKEVDTLIQSMIAELHTHGDVDILRSYLNIIHLKIRTSFFESSIGELQQNRLKNQKIILFKKLINQDYLLQKGISEYAQKLNITPNHLNALCKKFEGRTAIQLLQDRLLLEAKRLLYGTDMQAKEISYYLNFEDVAYFARFFKKHTRLTPIQYREHSLKNH